ncbi:MAG: Holliday junction branch migration DNA helicase RuvB [Phycisphaerae bacterium]|nr:Holliday junction branch migration DNA helicase RuvB [Phycisphaerae bacterium]OUX00950.1 MAG: Holliday junction branch migration DNA helicase RuvB [Phycisphaeraceae bacterium TMED231]
MARERIVSGESQAEEPVTTTDAAVPTPVVRPRSIAEYVGQAALIERLTIAIEAVKERKEAMEHVLLHGPPGLGKTTLAHVIANEMGTTAWVTSGPALNKAADLVGTLTKLGEGDVLFIDEIHRLPPAVEEYIYPAMEDFKVDFTVDSGMHAKVITLTLKPFTLIGATTRAGMLTQPLRARFGITHHLEYYPVADLVEILHRAVGRMGIESVEASGFDAIATRSRGTPRVALRLLRRVRDFAQVRGTGRIDAPAVTSALELEGVDELGLDEIDRKYLGVLADVYEGGPAGLEAIAATMGGDAGTLEDVVEPYLLQIGFLSRTPRGRKLTAAGAAHLRR